MRMNTLYKVLSSLTLLAALGACGGSTPPADEAEQSAKADDSEKKDDEKKDESADDSEKKDDEKADKKDDKADAKDDKKDKKDEEAPSTEGPKFTRTPKDILLAPEVVFMFSFNGSDAQKQAEEKCEKSSKNDPKKKNECVAKARKKFENADGFRFEKDGNDTWWWITVHKAGNKLVSVHKVAVEIEEKDKSVVLKPTGKDKGTKPWGRLPKEVKFDVPNDYQITQDDPKQGKLVYEAKIGILGDGSKPAR